MRPTQLLWIVVRVCLAGVVVWWVLDKADIRDVLRQAAHVHPQYLVLVMLALLVENLIKVFNWRQMLSVMLGRTVGFTNLLRANLAGCFLGLVVPSSAGTDAFRTLYSRAMFGGHVVVHAASMVALNLLNWFAGSLLGLAMLLALRQQDRFVIALDVVALIFAGVVIAVPGVYLLLRTRRNWLVHSLRGVRRKWFKVRHSARRFLDALLIFDEAHVSVPRVLIVYLLGVLAQGLAWNAAGVGVGVSLPLSCWILMVPVNGIANIVPLSISGFGFNQAAHLAVLSVFGVDAAQAVAVSALMMLAGTVYNLGIGGAGFSMVGRVPSYSAVR